MRSVVSTRRFALLRNSEASRRYENHMSAWQSVHAPRSWIRAGRTPAARSWARAMTAGETLGLPWLRSIQGGEPVSSSA